ncbi:acetoin utilization protein AcuC [Propionibacteriaceae bacterium ES.041]|uniref:acetoin utilization protein AcuC n=1 Tax=Enemella evansiae TaxID=2016499 RepID=UPI000B96B92A|nr:acetoin utilization protein AcuC [Enemella evansiae]OYO04579.1 acetoin utilization protein AcuC [Enemella evansiae]OYO09187.1 acetoin utilization protein AcuC [Enemella evansiae]PFG65941.1 acetoin utilization protein AcuC [Propionibacteriaceae bacterium ES.041]
MRARLVHSDELSRYDFGTGHPMGPGRVRLAVELARQLGVLDLLEVIEPPASDDDLVRLVHTEDYIEAVKADRVNTKYGIGTADNPLVVGMHEIAARVCAGTVEAARQVWTGQALRAANLSGGLHHAMPSATSGFCVYNDCAVAIRWLQQQGAQRILYLDVDAHHGDGVQSIMYNDPDVLTISLHESPIHLFPGTGFASETGGKDAPGSAVNVALPPGIDDAGWLRAFEAVVPPLVEEFQPDILISQHGCDSHRLDPLTDLSLSVEGQRRSYELIAELADRYAGGRWVASGGGGYALDSVVPRAWAHLLAILAGQPIDPTTPTPQAWRDLVGETAPSTMGDGADPSFESISQGYNPSSRVDQAIIATRRAVFPEFGLDPDY